MKEVRILLVEDDIDHVDLITEVLEANGIGKEIILVKRRAGSHRLFSGRIG